MPRLVVGAPLGTQARAAASAAAAGGRGRGGGGGAADGSAAPLLPPKLAKVCETSRRSNCITPDHITWSKLAKPASA